MLGALALGLAGCSDADEDADAQREDIATGQQDEAQAAKLVDGSLGPLIYRYDPEVLTRAEVDLPLPPDFANSVFAVKFLPSSMTDNLGQGGCSYGAQSDASQCTAYREVGLALALLERPISHYREQLANSDLADLVEDGATLAGATGFAFSRPSDRSSTQLRYIFVPLEDRTLLAVERTEDGIDDGADALAAVLESLAS